MGQKSYILGLIFSMDSQVSTKITPFIVWDFQPHVDIIDIASMFSITIYTDWIDLSSKIFS